MKKILLFIFVGILSLTVNAQNVMTPDLLWKLGRVSFVTQHPNGNEIIFRTSYYSLETESAKSTYYSFNLATGKKAPVTYLDGYRFIQWDQNGLYVMKNDVLLISKNQGSSFERFADGLKDAMDVRISPDGKWIAYSKSVQAQKLLGKDVYPDMPKTSAKIYTDLDYRHWDTYNDGTVNHVFVKEVGTTVSEKDILYGTAFNTPQKPFGGAEDFVFAPDGKSLVYVCKKKTGKAYATSTNTDLYRYELKSGTTTNLTEGMMGYDLQPVFNKDGSYLAWLSMARDGFEADKNDLVIMHMNSGKITNLTAKFDMTVDGGFYWSNDGNTIFYNATEKATSQLFWSDVRSNISPRTWSQARITNGQHDITGIYGDTKGEVIVSKTDMNHASELYRVEKKTGKLRPLSAVNDEIYNSITLSEVKYRVVKTSHGHDMGVWVVYPPDFDPNKKYPTLLYCQGGPQGAVSQFYSFRWNFQLMAAKGYIVVAPNRTGLPGYGVKWNEDISGDWGGQPMRDYLAAIDDVAKESYVDKSRIGAVGASYGGYSVFMLAGIHNNRFKSFISHCGLFDMKSWYGTTEELWFANWDLKGSYWQKNSPKAYTEFNPSNYVSKWNTPILIFQGEMDFRVPIEQGLQAFQAAQLQGLKSKLVMFPDENHWILKPQNAMVWHREFFSWLEETL